MLKAFAAFLIPLVFFTWPALGFTPDGLGTVSEVVVPYYDSPLDYLGHLSYLTPADPDWNAFTQRHGRWLASFNNLTGTVHRAYGGSIQVGVPSGMENAAFLAESFLRTEQTVLGVNVGDLYLTSSRHRGHHWFVDFGQRYQGLDVFNSRVSVRISDRGNVVLVECEFYPHMDVQTMPVIFGQVVLDAALHGITGFEAVSRKPELVVFPLPQDDAIEYRLAYRTEISTAEPARWLTIVDAVTGEILYRRNLIYSETVDGFVNGTIFPATPFDTLVSRPFEFERVQIGGVSPVYTDPDGFFTAEVPDQQQRTIATSFYGQCVQVLNDQGAEASFNGNIIPGDTLLIAWLSGNSRTDERNSYYHTNVIHDFIKALDPDFTDLDFPLTCNVNLAQTCNAYWDGSSINFFMAGGGCSNTGEIADVIYHEYGHGITDYQYRPSAPSGMQHEGWSDYTAATITNQPLIGRGFYSGDPEGYIRTVDNTNRWPDDLNGESHNDGLIIAGALWDLREALSPRTGYCDSLFHFARYGLSVNYQDYVLDILIYDDDDDNLFNHTPNWDYIIPAMDLHGLAPLDRMVISHDPLGDTDDSSNPYPVVVQLNYTLTPAFSDSIFVMYKTQRDTVFQALGMQPTGNLDEYTASIPAQPPQTLVEYYISLTDFSHRLFTDPVSAPRPTYFFLVGLQMTMQFADSLEQATAWTVGAPDDDADTGIWERVDPNGTYSDSIPNYPYQPEDDHTPDPGVYCFVTGQHPLGNPDNGVNDVDHGKTSLQTPSYDLSSYANPVVEYYRWFTTNRNIDDTFFVYISGDGGSTWELVERMILVENSWKRSRFLVNQVLSQVSDVRLRFVAADEGANSLVEGAVDDLTLYSFEITGVNEDVSLPGRFSLRPNYPNPFNGSTVISFDLPRPGDAEIQVFDIAGRLVSTQNLIGLGAGGHSIVWNAADRAGRPLSSGVYFMRLRSGDLSAERKMLYLK